MPLNKLENFIKNTEGRVLYVNPNDLDSTDGVENQGNSLTKPFKTIQRALIEAARFSYLRGNDNDLVERTTILIFPGDHVIDNRPGFGIRNESGIAKAISPSGSATGAQNTLTLTLNSNFDLTQEDNILYKFNSVHGGIVVPRGTSIVGLDLRKTRIRPLYVPNPTDNNVKSTAIFRITGACYFWQFTFFDGDEAGLVYTDPSDFSANNQSKPTFSHHKITAFEYADGVNTLDNFSDLTDLDIYYSKLTNAFNRASNREIDQKYPSAPAAFSPQRPEFEIVGAFATDPLNITNIESGDGATPGQVVTVTTQTNHNLTGGTPIKIRGINVADYNISTKVSNVIDDTRFQFSLPFVRPNLPAGSAGGLSSANGQVLVETDTVTGASPYIFNCSMRSVYGMQGLHADGAKATGFKSMVTAQFTAVSLQKDDRAFVKYDKTNRRYSGIAFSKQTGALLSSESSSTNPETVFHLDQEANYRKGFRTTHIKVSNDAVVQIVSVFAIGFHAHFEMINGADASITNSNSNFGTFSLLAEGFKKEAFAKDDKGFITSVITPRSIVNDQQQIEFLQIDVSETTATKLFLFAQPTLSLPPAHIAQGFRIGARFDEKLFIDNGGSTFSATVVMPNGASGTSNVGEKNYEAIHSDASASTKSVFTINAGHELANGESIRIIADNGDLPENIDPHTVYFAITSTQDSALGANQIRIASSKTNADLAIPVFVATVASTTDKFRIVSRVSDKRPNDAGHPIQYDTSAGQWFVHTLAAGNTIHNGSSIYANATDDDITYVLRTDDDRSLDEKIYKLRYVVPKELTNGRDPTDGFVLQDSSSTNVLANTDFSKTTITANDYAFDRNTRFISQASFDSTENLITIRSDKPHNLGVGDQVVVRNVQSTTNSNALVNKGYNGTFLVSEIKNDKEFRYSNVDTAGVTHTTGTFTNNTQTRSTLLPRFDRNDNSGNFFVYRTETITPYIQGVQDGVHHLFVLNSNNAMDEPSNEFSEKKYNQNIVNLFPEYDRDNINANPPAAVSYAKRFPIGDVVTNDLKKSITRETTNQFLKNFEGSIGITSVVNNNTNAVINLNKEHSFQSLKFHNTLNGGSGHTDGTYYNVRLLNSNATPATAPWDGATAKVVVSSNAVTSVEITDGGSAYTNGETLFFDSQTPALGGIGGSPNASLTIATAGISSATGHYIQVTGITTGTDSYHRISSINSTKQITVAKSAADTLLDGQQIHDMGPWVAVGSATTTSGTTTFTTPVDHGLAVGNKFRILNSNDASLGDFVVTSIVGITQFSAKTTTSLTDAKYILKHGLSDNESISGVAGENIDVRGFNIFDHETLILNEAIGTGDAAFKVKLPDGTTTATSIVNRFPLGSYIQIGGEIMRVASSSLSGGGGDEITVIRGSLGTNTETHLVNSRIKKVKPLPIELRRPSILRSSGHTFEYVGFGPGNYSTALPQLQNRSLTEREEFLNQAQETSCGNVVYTGMNDKGDFYIGNTKIASASGQQTTFDIPVATVTGEDPNRLSAVFDEVVVKERLLVEGGASKQILSQFDGPVTFNSDLRLSDNTKQLITEAEIRAQDAKFRDTTNSTAVTNGAVVIDGGMGIAKDIVIGGNIIGDGATNISGIASVTATSFFGDGAGLTNTGAQLTATSGSQRVVLTTLTSGTMTSATTDGDLTFNASTNTLSCPNFVGAINGNAGTATLATNVVGGANRVIFNNNTDTTTTSAALTFDGTQLNVTNNIRANNLTLGLTAGTTINTTTGDLVLDSSNNKVHITANAEVDGSMTIDSSTNSSSKDTGALVITAGGLGVEGNIHCGGDIIAFSSSDVNLKYNINIITNALDKINAISGNTFTWKDTEDTFLSGNDTGVIAQEVEALGLPGITTTRDDGFKAVNYHKLVPLLIEAVKELSARVSALEGS
tara:strand:+ start:1471 stop:7194 length:5724 start_codon:yes stop_codon:yes gene_type:complete